MQKLLTTFGEIDKQTARSLPKFSPLLTDGPLLARNDNKDEKTPEGAGAEDWKPCTTASCPSSSGNG